MKLNQISVFLENKPGQLKLACKRLADANINILTLSLADTKQFGVLHLITPEWERARDVFKQSGFIASVNDVLAVEVADRPGGLVDVLDAIDEAGLNVEYMYAFTFGDKGKAALIFRFSEADAAVEKLKASGVNLIGKVELFARSGK
ncbi:MAG: ACT domain-containing protein [Anaerolineales bacterium]